MKCPICNLENPPEASSCQRCGFGFALTQSLWPDSPLVEPAQEAVEPEQAPPPPAAEPPPLETDSPPVLPDANALAREHIAEGFQAIRQQDPQRARQEFQQACELADDPAIVHLAQTQLDALEPPAPEADAPPEPDIAPRPAAASARTLPAQLPALDRADVARVGLVLGLVNAVICACGAACCLVGMISSMALGLLTGWLTLHQARCNLQSASMRQAALAGAWVGAGGWLGQTAGLFLFYSSMIDDVSNAATWLCLSFMAGALYLLFGMSFAALGWRLQSSQLQSRRSSGGDNEQ